MTYAMIPDRTLTIGEFTLCIWRDTYVARVPWTGATTFDTNSSQAEIDQYVTVKGDEGDDNDNNKNLIDFVSFDTSESTMVY